MRVEFDPAKNAANIAKHGIALSAAADFDLATALFERDDRLDYGEERFIAIGMLNGRVHVMIFTLRKGGLRVISLRKANLRERKRYES